MNLPVVFSLMLCFLFIVAYTGKKGTVGKDVQDIKDHSSLFKFFFLPPSPPLLLPLSSLSSFPSEFRYFGEIKPEC